jgi:heme exporter protein C
MDQVPLAVSVASILVGRSGSIIRDGLLLASAVLMALTLWMVFFWVPTEASLGVSQRIFYFHVPISILALSSIIVVAIASIIHLITRGQKSDDLAYSAAELGAVLATLAIVTGATWAKPVWGVWWTWDPKLTLTLLLWFIYSGYLMLRAYGPKGSQGARYGAVIALMGAVNAPIIYYATELWQTAHPALLVGPAAESGSLDSDMALGLLASTITFFVLAAYMLIERYSLRRSETAIDALYQYVG